MRAGEMSLQRWARALLVAVRSLDFRPCPMGSHWGVLSRGGNNLRDHAWNIRTELRREVVGKGREDERVNKG